MTKWAVFRLGLTPVGQRAEQRREHMARDRKDQAVGQSLRTDHCRGGLGYDGNTILVLFAGADQTDFGMFDLQNRPPLFG